MSEQDNVVRLKIFGEEFSVKSQADEVYLQEVAEYVDQHMREISDNLPASQPMVRIAVLAAMNICDELFEMQNRLDEVKRTYSQRSSELTDRIESALAAAEQAEDNFM